MKETTHRLIEKFFKEYPEMSYLFDRACLAVEKMAGVYLPNKIMTCGNGGSFSDSGHIVGELMKSFLKKRPAALSDGDEAVFGKLEGAVPALCLGESSPLATAVLNDIGGEWIFAQQVFGLGCAGDVLIGLSTSGNSAGVLRAVRVAKRKGVFTVAMTGQSGGALKEECDLLLNVPAAETYRVQELHLPLYHLLCAAVESERWD